MPIRTPAHEGRMLINNVQMCQDLGCEVMLVLENGNLQTRIVLQMIAPIPALHIPSSSRNHPCHPRTPLGRGHTLPVALSGTETQQLFPPRLMPLGNVELVSEPSSAVSHHQAPVGSTKRFSISGPESLNTVKYNKMLSWITPAEMQIKPVRYLNICL